MGKCVITLEDNADGGLRIEAEWDPPLVKDVMPEGMARQAGLIALNAIQESVDRPDNLN